MQVSALSVSLQLYATDASKINRWSVGLQLYVTDAYEINRWSVGLQLYATDASKINWTILTYRAAVAAHPLEFEVLRCRTYEFASFFLPAQICSWGDLP